MENLTHALSEQWNLTERMISRKCLIYGRPSLISCIISPKHPPSIPPYP